MKKWIWFTAALLLVAGCTKYALEEHETNNTHFSVETLFEHEGCKVYRFKDGGDPIYYTNCKGTTRWDKSDSDHNAKHLSVSGGAQ
jgi:hypothetical protein